MDAYYYRVSQGSILEPIFIYDCYKLSSTYFGFKTYAADTTVILKAYTNVILQNSISKKYINEIE